MKTKTKTTLYDGSRRRRGGATLVEIVIVVAIIGILAAVAVPNFLDWWRLARVKTTTTTINGAGKAFGGRHTDLKPEIVPWTPLVPGVPLRFDFTDYGTEGGSDQRLTITFNQAPDSPLRCYVSAAVFTGGYATRTACGPVPTGGKSFAVLATDVVTAVQSDMPTSSPIAGLEVPPGTPLSPAALAPCSLEMNPDGSPNLDSFTACAGATRGV